MASHEEISGYVAELTRTAGSAPESLLQHLCETQQRFNWIPPAAVTALAQHLNLGVAQVRAVIDFYAFLHAAPRGDFDILFSDSITDHMLGSRRLLQRLCGRLGVTPGTPRADGRVTVDVTSCTGMCDQGPALLVNGRALTRLDDDRVDAIAGLVEQGTPLADWPADYFTCSDNIRRRDRLLDAPRDRGAALKVLQQQGADALLAMLRESGLRGRGGAGFPTAAKWQFCCEAAGEARYVVCNADEGEPGTFKDRVLLNSYADEMFEGMTLCAGVIGAREGYLYLRGEYRYLRDALEAALSRRRRDGLLGRSILGVPGFDFDIHIHLGAGAYVCGEESALIESLEGKRGIPRKRPPFPVTQGFRGQPTVVNNVETFCAATAIARFGAPWFCAAGTEASRGTKLFSISGDCGRPGLYEYPLGVSIRQVLEDCGGEDAQAVQLSGAAGRLVPRADFGARLAFEDAPAGGSIMVFGPGRDLLDAVRNFAHFFAHESCGFCTPCRVGATLVEQLLDKVHAGRASAYDLQELRSIGALMQQASHCGLGTTAPNPVLDSLEHLPELYERRLAHRDYTPAFDLDAELEQARRLTGRDDPGAHLGGEP